MKAARPFLLAAVLATLFAAPTSAATKVHDDGLTCATDEATGMTSCFSFEVDTRSTDDGAGITNVKMDGTSHASVTDINGDVVWSYDQAIHQKSLIVQTASGPLYKKLITDQVEQFTDHGITWCVVSYAEIRDGVEVSNEVVTSDGPC
jgi:hypothetical protein